MDVLAKIRKNKKHNTSKCKPCQEIFGRYQFSHWGYQSGICELCERKGVGYEFQIPIFESLGITRICGDCKESIVYFFNHDLNCCIIDASAEALSLALILHITYVLDNMIYYADYWRDKENWTSRKRYKTRESIIKERREMEHQHTQDRLAFIKTLNYYP